MEYPEYDNQYIPFLDTEILIKDNGEISSRYYRKPRNKGITLNYRSHHQMGTKSAVSKNYYKTAREVSLGPVELQHSLNIVDNVLKQNGYPNPRSFDRLDNKTDKTRHGTSFSTLSLPYTTKKVVYIIVTNSLVSFHYKPHLSFNHKGVSLLTE